MKTLLVVATLPEIQPLLNHLDAGAVFAGQVSRITDSLSVIVTGAGMINTTYFLTKSIAETKPELVLNAGIGGSFDRTVNIGEVVRVEEEVFGDLGAEDDDVFLSLEEIGLGVNKVNVADVEFYSNHLIEKLRGVKAISVNRVHGCESTINRVKEKFNPDIESMEGAAVMQVCLMEKIKYLQLRSISNYVEKRDKSKWQIPLSIKNLNDLLIDLVPILK